MKYVIGRNKNEAGEVEFHAAIFSGHQYHQEQFGELQKKTGPLAFYSAAHCDPDYNKMEVKVHGKSVGYGTKATVHDAEILTKLFKEDKLHEL